ncbi:MAG: hypothetical protein Q8L84_04815 [Hyphomonas sp.]|nr:hypothetical protein [Hyphomonas sp.]
MDFAAVTRPEGDLLLEVLVLSALGFAAAGLAPADFLAACFFRPRLAPRADERNGTFFFAAFFFAAFFFAAFFLAMMFS